MPSPGPSEHCLHSRHPDFLQTGSNALKDCLVVLAHSPACFIAPNAERQNGSKWIKTDLCGTVPDASCIFWLGLCRSPPDAHHQLRAVCRHSTMLRRSLRGGKKKKRTTVWAPVQWKRHRLCVKLNLEWLSQWPRAMAWIIWIWNNPKLRLVLQVMCESTRNIYCIKMIKYCTSKEFQRVVQSGSKQFKNGLVVLQEPIQVQRVQPPHTSEPVTPGSRNRAEKRLGSGMVWASGG